MFVVEWIKVSFTWTWNTHVKFLSANATWHDKFWLL